MERKIKCKADDGTEVELKVEWRLSMRKKDREEARVLLKYLENTRHDQARNKGRRG